MKEIIDQLSPREKKLLYILVCFLLVVGGWFFVAVPLMDTYNNLSFEYENAIVEKTSLDKSLSDYVAAPDLLSQKQDSYKNIIDKYNKILTNEEIDKLLTNAFLSHGLKPLSLNITSVGPVNSSSSDTTTDNKNQQDNSKTGTESKNTQTANSMIQANVTVKVSGDLKKITNAISYLNGLKGVQVSSFSYSNNDSANSDTTLNIIVYMVNK